MKVLVTGAGGLVGTSLCERLVVRGHEVWGLARGDYPYLRALGVHTVRADLADFARVAPLFKNVGACFHAAAKVAMWGHWRDFLRANVTGTQNVIRACKAHGVPFLVYTSTPSVVFEDQSIERGDESLPFARKSYSNYAHSKALAEGEVLAANGEDLKTLALQAPPGFWAARPQPGSALGGCRPPGATQNSGGRGTTWWTCSLSKTPSMPICRPWKNWKRARP